MKITIVELDPTGIELNRIESQTNPLKMVDGYNSYMTRSRFIIYSDVNEPNEILGMFRIMQDVETLDINIEFSDLLNKYYNYKK